ncbi:unnamed protein product [Prunus armeniaca]|uniref:Thioredoxin domain-containing protein n=1 Tax=Prunus armeniaca TaxID=36596 RepID=A0A6J5VNU0_PRUAR|nr:unnamed protein product [Prunus armeniaca]
MAVSVTASTISSFSSDRTTRIAATSSSSASCSKLSSSSFLQVPVQLRCVRIGRSGVSAPSRPRILPVVAAKKQTFSSFEDLLATSDKPVLVDFYATWCGPCQFMAPILNEVSITLNDKIQVALPTFIIFKDGEPYDRFEGALTADQLVERIETTLQVKQ